jgi:hypothetical protein
MRFNTTSLRPYLDPGDPASIVDAPAPRAGDGAASPNGWTDRSLDGKADAQRDEMVRRG